MLERWGGEREILKSPSNFFCLGHPGSGALVIASSPHHQLASRDS